MQTSERKYVMLWLIAVLCVGRTLLKGKGVALCPWVPIPTRKCWNLCEEARDASRTSPSQVGGDSPPSLGEGDKREPTSARRVT